MALTLKQVKKVVVETMEVGFEKQAVLINQAFQNQTDHFNGKFNQIDRKFHQIDQKFNGLNEKIDRIENKVDRALHKEYTNLEGRVKKIENHLNLKPDNNQRKI